jgi:DNA/RNA endonuclease YhcR with UshA esterase domain
MRMQKEEKIVMVLLFMALGSLAVASWAFLPPATNGQEMPKDELRAEGTVLEINPTKSGGHLMIQLDSLDKPIFVSRDSGASEVQEQIHPGDRVVVRGKVSVFGGREETKVSSSSDIKKL